MPNGLIPLAQAQFDDPTGWSLDATWTHGAGVMAKTPSASAEFLTWSAPIPAGDIWVSFVIESATAGWIKPLLASPALVSVINTRDLGQHVARFTSVGHGSVRLKANVAFSGTLGSAQVVDMTSILSQPADIYIAAGGGLMAAEVGDGPIDPAKDAWIDRCLHLPGHLDASLDLDPAVPAALTAPVQMVNPCAGLSPILPFVQGIEAATSAGRSILVVSVAEAASGLLGSGGVWNPSGTDPTAYARMVSQTQAALARVPGSVVKGLIWAQGEADRSATVAADYGPGFQAMLAQLRIDLAEPTLPCLVMGPAPDDADPHQAALITAQSDLDTGSGTASATAGVHFVARDPGGLSADGVHPTAVANRTMGAAAAARFIAEGLV